MKKRLSPLALMILTGLANMPLYAAHEHDDETLDRVTVTAASVPTVDSTTLSEKDISSQRAYKSDTAAFLNDVAGMSMYSGGGVAGLPFMRGFADDRLRIKVDGMDLISACANHMNPPLSYLTPSRVSEIQVYSGIAPVSLGGDSIGGTIIAKSKQPEFATDGQTITKGEIGSYYRSNGDARGGHLSTTLASEDFSVTYTGSTAKANNYDGGGNFKPAGNAATDRGSLDSDEVGSSAYESRNHAIDFAYKLDNHQLQLKFAHQDIPYQGWPNQRMDMTENRSNQINLFYNGLFNWGSLETSVYREKTHHKMQFGDDKQFLYGSGMMTALGMPMETEGDNRGLSVKAEINANQRDLFRVGTELQRYRLDDFWEASGGMMMAPNTFWNINNGERDRYGVFAEWEAAWNSQWTTVAGIRHETVKMNTDDVQGYNTNMMMYQAAADAFNASDRDITDHNIDATLLARFKPSATHDYEFGYAQKTRSPNLYERFAWSTNGMAMRMVNLVGDGNGYVGNVELDPEIAHTLSFTANFHDAKQHDWHVSLTPYISYVDDFIDAERCSTGGGACIAANLSTEDNFVNLQYQNVSAKLYGMDVSGFKTLYQSAQWGKFTGTATLSYVRGKNRDTGDDLYNIMPLNSTLSLEHSKNGWRNNIEWVLVAGKDKVNNERNEIETAGYGLVNLRTSYEWKQARVDFGMENVFDRLYSHPLSGAYLGQGATMGTDIPWGVTVPGMGRSVYAGLTLKF
ncbi:TonB-dependent receptor plug domain-containing protein [Methylophaga sp.]|uniref:TonB-dependent receptor plug domain-containing protein n=1 Tax=Methylophaga sp. TaxID=2024840 RepID=UPI003A92D455